MTTAESSMITTSPTLTGLVEISGKVLKILISTQKLNTQIMLRDTEGSEADLDHLLLLLLCTETSSSPR